MKLLPNNLIPLLALLLPVCALSQGGFIIGADRLHYPDPCDGNLMTPTEWDSVKAFGLNYGSYFDGNTARIKDVLSNQAVPRGIKLMVYSKGYDSTFGQRWKFHPEYDKHFPQDPNILTGEAVIDAGGSDLKTATLDPMVTDRNYPNSRRAIAGRHNPGYLCRDLIPCTFLLDYQNVNWARVYPGTVHLRLRLRLENPVYNSVSIATVSVVHKNHPVDSVYLQHTVTTEDFARTPYDDQPWRLGNSDRYAEVYIGAFSLGDSTAPIDIRIYWPGNVDVHIDYVSIDDERAHELFGGNYNQHIYNSVNGLLVNGQAPDGMWRLKINDEPFPKMTPCIGYVQDRINYKLPQAPPTATYCHEQWVRGGKLRYYLEECRQLQLLVNAHPFHLATGNDPSSNQAVDSILIPALDSVAKTLRDDDRYSDITFIVAPQLHNWPATLREPTIREIAMQTHLAACYGAKGIYYWPYDGCSIDDDSVWGALNPTEHLVRTIDSYGENKWEGLKDLNKTLDELGDVLAGLKWRDAFSRKGLSNLPPLVFRFESDSANITDIRTSPDEDKDSLHIHIGQLQDGSGDDFLYTVNRRIQTDGTRNIQLFFDNSSSISITDIESGCERILPDTALFTAEYPPGTGRLFRITEAVWDKSKTLTGCGAVVEDSAVLHMKGGVAATIPDGSVLQIEGEMICDTMSYLKLAGGVIDVTGRLVLNDPRSLRGTGRIEGNGTIVFNAGLKTESADTITFAGGLDLQADSCQVNGGVELENRGRLMIGENSTLRFSGCWKRIFIASGSLELQRGVTFENTPDVLSYKGTLVLSDGNGEDSCRWLMRDESRIDIYGIFIAKKSLFKSYGEAGSETGWDGLLFGYEDSRGELDSCRILGIRMIPDTGGCALHYYAASDDSNRVYNSVISRSAASNDGNGVFLQPGVPGSAHYGDSYLTLACNEISSDWYSGIASVASRLRLVNNHIMDNEFGICADLASMGYLQENCVYDNCIAGLRLTDQSNFKLGDASEDIPGGNRIADNGSTQFHLKNGSTLLGGNYDSTMMHGGADNISAASQYTPRIVAEGSTAFVRNEYWGNVPIEPDTLNPGYWVIPPSAAQNLFIQDTASNIVYNPVFNSSAYDPPALSCLNSCEIGQIPPFRKSSPLAPNATGFHQLPAYAARGNYSEVYRFLTAYTQARMDRFIRSAVMALALEQRLAWSVRDSTTVCSQRLSAFLNALYSQAVGDTLRARLLDLKCRAALVFSEIEECEENMSRLASTYPAAWQALRMPLFRLAVTMVKGDDNQVDSAFRALCYSSPEPADLRLARSMKRGYDRVLPRRYLPKPGGSGGGQRPGSHNESDGILRAMSLETFPNPFNSMVTIKYLLEQDTKVTLEIYSAHGRRVALLADEPQKAGVHRHEFNIPSMLPSGVYLSVLRTKSGAVIARMILAR